MNKLIHIISCIAIVALLAVNIQLGINGEDTTNSATSESFTIFSTAVAQTNPGEEGDCTGCTDCLYESCGGDRSYCGLIKNVETGEYISCDFDNQ